MSDGASFSLRNSTNAGEMDQDLDILPDYGAPYFDHLRARYRALRDTNPTLAASTGPDVERLVAESSNSSLSWHDLYLLERAVKSALSTAEISREVWALRSRYRQIAGLAEYEAYLASKPPSLDDHTTTTEEALSILRADMEFLLSEIYVGYSMEPRRQQTRRQVSRYVAWCSLVGLLLIIASAIIAAWEPDRFTGAATIPVMVVGAMGALFSMQRRYQSIPNEGDPIFSTGQLRRGKMDIFVTASIGAVSAAILFLLFAGEMVAGQIFPKMVPSATDEGTRAEAIGFFKFMSVAGPQRVADYAKLLVWAFIAGFAERWVPDTLTQLTARKDAAQVGKP
jgi:hypothetical protein